MKTVAFWLVLTILHAAPCSGNRESFAPTEVDSVLEAEKHYRFGKQYDKNGMHEDAIVQYQKSLAFRTDNPNVHYDLANLFFRLQRYEEAQQECLRSLEADSTFVLGHYLLALLWYNAADYDSAIVEFEKTIALDPSYKQIHQTLASLYVYRGLEEEALVQYLRAAEVAAELPREERFELFLHLGNLAAGKGFVAEAISCYRSALTCKKDEQVQEKLARLQSDSGFHRGALDAYLTLAGTDTTDDQLYLKIADISVKLGAFDRAIFALEKLAALRPTDPEPLCHLAEIQLRRGESEAAKAYIDRGLAIAQDNLHLYVLAGEYHKNKGAKELALNSFKKALSDPTWGEYAQQMIWEIEPPLSEEEKLKREFFDRGKQKKQ